MTSDLSYETVGTDISCNLGSTNIDNMLQAPDFGRAVEVAVRALTNVTDTTNIEEVPSIAKGNRLYHTIGLGAMRLHTAWPAGRLSTAPRRHSVCEASS